MNYANPYVPNQQQPYKLKVPIIVLSFLALAIGLVRFIMDANYYFEDRQYMGFIPFLFNFISLVVYMIPIVTWLVFTLMPRNSAKATILVGVTFAFVALRSVLFYVTPLASGYGFPNYYTFCYIFDVLTLVTFIPAAILVCIGHSNRVFLIIPSFLALVYEVVCLIVDYEFFGWLLDESLYMDFFSSICLYLAPIILHAVVILFAAANDFTRKASNTRSFSQYTPQYVPQNAPQYAPQNAPQNTPQYVPQYVPQNAPQYVPQGAPQQMTPDAELRMIYSQRQQGIITEEEYQARRARIIQYLN